MNKSKSNKSLFQQQKLIKTQLAFTKLFIHYIYSLLPTEFKALDMFDNRYKYIKIYGFDCFKQITIIKLLKKDKYHFD